jgi:hypothetical protein
VNRMPREAARHSREIAKAIAEARRTSGLERRKGVVTAIASGPPITCSVQLGSERDEFGAVTSVPGVPVLDSYSPAVGDAVWVLFAGSDALIVGSQASGGGSTLSASFVEVFDAQSTPVRRVRFGLQLDGRYGLRVWGSNGLLNYDFTTT